jgi:hypothetical protein
MATLVELKNRFFSETNRAVIKDMVNFILERDNDEGLILNVDLERAMKETIVFAHLSHPFFTTLDTSLMTTPGGRIGMEQLNQLAAKKLAVMAKLEATGRNRLYIDLNKRGVVPTNDTLLMSVYNQNSSFGGKYVGGSKTHRSNYSLDFTDGKM